MLFNIFSIFRCDRAVSTVASSSLLGICSALGDNANT
jgi:hypothetical protein